MQEENSKPDVSRRRVLQGSAALGVIGLGPTAANADDEELTSKGENDGESYSSNSVDKRIRQVGTFNEERSAVVIKDCNPWGAAGTEEALEDIGVPYEVINSDRLGDYDIGTHNVAIIPSTQDATYYDNVAAERSVLEDFVADGGTLVGHVADNGRPCTTTWTESFLPESPQRTVSFIDDVEIVIDQEERSYPVLDGLEDGDISGWNFSTHGVFTKVPDNADIIVGTSGDATDEPTYLEYEVGEGRVLATTHTMEWPYAQPFFGTQALLRNELEYALEGTDEPEGRLDELIDEKVALAGDIDDVGATLNEQPRVEATLDELAAAVNAGDIAEDRATEAVQRKQSGESITRSYVGGVSPEDTSDFDTGGEITELAITAGTQGLIGAAAIGRLANFVGWGRLGRKLGSAKDRLLRGMESAIDTLVGTFSRASEFVRNRSNEFNVFLRELIIDGGITSGATLADELAERIDTVRDGGANLILQFYEEFISGATVTDDLEKLDRTLGPADGGPTFDGTISDVREAEAAAIADIEATLEDTDRKLSRIESGLAVASFLGVAASALVVTGFGSITGLTLSLIEVILGVAAALLGVTVGMDGIRSAHRTHNDGIDAVIDGRSEV